jgi:DNA-binding MarR family transcriptional regulator
MRDKELEIIMGFPRVFHVFMRKMMRGFQTSEEMSLNPTQRRTLLIMYDKGILTMTALHEFIGLEKGSLTTVIDQLIRKGLVKRTRDEKDRRRVNISLSETGRKKVRILRMQIAGHIKKNLERLPAEVRERFYRAVESLIDISNKL